jgi:hypothetical protein
LVDGADQFLDVANWHLHAPRSIACPWSSDGSARSRRRARRSLLCGVRGTTPHESPFASGEITIHCRHEQETAPHLMHSERQLRLRSQKTAEFRQIF